MQFSRQTPGTRTKRSAPPQQRLVHATAPAVAPEDRKHVRYLQAMGCPLLLVQLQSMDLCHHTTANQASCW